MATLESKQQSEADLLQAYLTVKRKCSCLEDENRALQKLTTWLGLKLIETEACRENLQCRILELEQNAENSRQEIQDLMREVDCLRAES